MKKIDVNNDHSPKINWLVTPVATAISDEVLLLYHIHRYPGTTYVAIISQMFLLVYLRGISSGPVVWDMPGYLF